MQIFLVVNIALCQVNRGYEQFKFPLKSVTGYCQDNPDSIISTVFLKYDNNNRLIKLVSFRNESDSVVTDFNYNEHGLLASRHYYSLPNSKQSERTRIFKYDEKNNLIYEGYDDDKGNNTKNNYSYDKDGKLITSTEECNYTHWEFSYEYDSQGRLTKKYKNGDFDEVSYEYSQSLLVGETHKQRSGDTETTYDYDGNGLLLYKKENGKVIERNIYSKGQLVELWTYYFGIDPGFHPCNSQYISKYEYY